MKYCEAVYQSKRWKTREVKVGKVGVGGNNPVRIQSMTTSSTRDVEATVDQIIRLADSGCEIARVTVQGMKEADSCEGIKNRLIQKGYDIPLVADIHFYPPAAMRVVDFVDKVRINPGNFVDKRASFVVLEYDDASYQAEIEKIEEAFTPLVEKCIRLKRSMRIGTNHGSLSDRIMNRYGDTPFGMVESALEFARVCRKLNYHDIIFSMKASNPIVMVQAYRLLVAEMMKLGWDYPLHLGVTEAGEGEDGRIKSAVGIGALLLDGIGDTIRVSLTEDPWLEIDPCQRLVKFAEKYQGKGIEPFLETHRDISAITRRPVVLSQECSLHRDGTVILQVTPEDLQRE
ncbi:MAG: (E)-4-hydroxy-3-methylbut-2-enyl-diphosphate synthase, partial [Chlamydiota bacterium]